VRGILKNPLIGWGITIIQNAFASSRMESNLFYIFCGMKKLKLILAGYNWIKNFYLKIQAAAVHLVPESMQTVFSQWMVLAKSIPAELFARIYTHSSAACHGLLLPQGSLVVTFI
jgi:hypothetical protein